jgi:ABC-type polysaccharide/polyol phosphate export permease
LICTADGGLHVLVQACRAHDSFHVFRVIAAYCAAALLGLNAKRVCPLGTEQHDCRQYVKAITAIISYVSAAMYLQETVAEQHYTLSEYSKLSTLSPLHSE